MHHPPQLPHATSYEPPRGNVLLLSCMDLRLLDNIVDFMNHDNLTNRYDQAVFAGAALGALGAPGANGNYKHWRKAFFDHLDAAIKLHDVEDVYILEHRNCGAYHKVFKVCPDYGNSPAEQRDEELCHLKYATRLERRIARWANKHQVTLRTHKFLMDLRGVVKPLW